MVKVAIRSEVKNLFAAITQKQLKQIFETSQVCHVPELGSYTQGQSHNHVRGQIVPKIVLLINYESKFDENSQKDKA